MLLKPSIFILIPICLAAFSPPFAYAKHQNSGPVFHDFPMPESFSLCGEPMPLENPHVWEMLDRELTISVWDRAQVFMWLKRAGRYLPHVEKRLKEEGMPLDLKYVAVAESSLLTHIRSRKGALGPWQFMSRTAKRNGLRRDRLIDERRSFERSTEAALKFLRRLKKDLGNWTLALAAYNCGDARLKRNIKEQQVRDYYRLKLPKETERYIFRIAAIKLILENPELYGYRISPDRIYRPIEADEIKIRIKYPIPITKVAKALGTDFKTLKILNPHITRKHLPSGHYWLKVPSGMGPEVAGVLKKFAPGSSKGTKQVSGDFYVVQPGDTLSHIARRSGVPIATLRNLNGIDGSLIMVGQKLRIAP